VRERECMGVGVGVCVGVCVRESECGVIMCSVICMRGKNWKLFCFSILKQKNTHTLEVI